MDKSKVRSYFSKAVNSYQQFAILQQQVENEMLSRLDGIKINPTVIADIGSGTGRASHALLKKYSKAQVVSIDLSELMLKKAKDKFRFPWQSHFFICADSEHLPLKTDSVDLIYSNLMLQWCDFEKVFKECQRVLKPNGLFIFSTFGPQTLIELKNSWAKLDDRQHVNKFTDMHILGDALLAMQFSDPVMDRESYVLTYKNLKAVLKDLKGIGANYVDGRQQQGLMGKEKWCKLQKNYANYRNEEGLLPASYEVLFGLAWIGNTKIN